MWLLLDQIRWKIGPCYHTIFYCFFFIYQMKALIFACILQKNSGHMVQNYLSYAFIKFQEGPLFWGRMGMCVATNVFVVFFKVMWFSITGKKFPPQSSHCYIFTFDMPSFFIELFLLSNYSCYRLFCYHNDMFIFWHLFYLFLKLLSYLLRCCPYFFSHMLLISYLKEMLWL